MKNAQDYPERPNDPVAQTNDAPLCGQSAPESEVRPAPQVAIPERQWKLPVSYAEDGERLVTLKEFIEEGTAILPLEQLTSGQMANLVAKRIESQDKFEIAMMGVGIVNKERAIAEVTKENSSAGCVIMEIERRVINLIRNQAMADKQ